VKKVKSGGVVQRPRTERFYDTEDKPRRLYTRKTHHHTPKFRKSLQRGAILILLSGKFRGRRVVLLDNLPSGLLLVTGPYVVNGVPLKRVNPAYVIATSTQLDIKGFELPKHLNDEYFTRPKKVKSKTKPEQRFEGQEEKKEVVKKQIDAKRIEDQKLVDKQIVEQVGKVENLRYYLKSKFSLSRHQYPHLLKF